MEPLVRVVTLAAADVARSVAFYRAVFRAPEPSWRPGYATFDGGGVRLAVCDREVLRAEVGTTGGPAVLSHQVARAEDVDALLATAARAGAVVLVAARERPWGGRSGSFADPDGHVWEVAWRDPAGRRG